MPLPSGFREVLRVCEIRTADNRSGDYQPCPRTASRISRFGWFSCDQHASVVDEKISEVSDDELEERMKFRERNL